MRDRIGCEELNYRLATSASALDTGFLFLRNIPPPTTQVYKNFAGTFSQSQGGAVQHGCTNVTLTWTELTPKQAYWIKDQVDTALAGSKQLYLTIKANDAQKWDYDWIDYVGTPHPVDFAEGGTMPGLRGRAYVNCTLFVNCLTVVSDPTTGDPIAAPPPPCTDTFGGAYPSLDGLALNEWCWQAIDDISVVAKYDDPALPCVGGAYTQMATIVNKTFELYGIDHPGNKEIGFVVYPGVRPANAYALAITCEFQNGTTVNGNLGNLLAYPTTLITGGGNNNVADTQIYLAYVNPATNPITTPLVVNGLTAAFDVAQIGMVDVPTSGNMYFSVAAAGGLCGLDYDVLYKDIAWLVKET